MAAPTTGHALEYRVYYHGDGGQCCDPTWRDFADPDEAVLFATGRINDPGHKCRNSVSVSILSE